MTSSGSVVRKKSGPVSHMLIGCLTQSFSRLQGVSASLKSIVLVENSDKMREVQEAKLAKECEKKGIKLEWVDSIDDVPPSQFLSSFSSPKIVLRGG